MADRAGLRAMQSISDPSATTTFTVLTALFLSGSRECRKTVMQIRCPRPRPESRDATAATHLSRLHGFQTAHRGMIKRQSSAITPTPPSRYRARRPIPEMLVTVALQDIMGAHEDALAISCQCERFGISGFAGEDPRWRVRHFTRQPKRRRVQLSMRRAERSCWDSSSRFPALN